MAVTQVHIVHVVINEHGAIFAELIELLSESIRRAGAEVSLGKNQLAADRTNLLIGSTAFLRADQLEAYSRSPTSVIVFQAEALDDVEGHLPHRADYWRFLESSARIWDYSEKNVRFLVARGVGGGAAVSYVPLGYAASLERIAPAAVPDIDVLHYGVLPPRRARVLEDLHRRGLKVVHAFGCYGAARDALIARARLVVNIHDKPSFPLEQVRISYLLNNRRLVVSEVADCNPYGDGVVFCPYEQLADRCAELLAPGREDDRRQIAQRGYEQLRAIPMDERVRAALGAPPSGG